MVPPLLNGDHLAVPEFERRYEAATDIKFAELIEGIVVMSPPISNDHSEGQMTLGFFLKRYSQLTPGVSCGGNVSIRLDGQNEFEPDAVLRIDAGSMARSKIAPKGLVEGGPELVAEIAVSSAGYDLFEKKAVYQRNSVPEYIVWQVLDAKTQWFMLEDGQYITAKPSAEGVIRSRVFPGLWLNINALLAGDEATVERSLKKGLRSPEHREFVKRLRDSHK